MGPALRRISTRSPRANARASSRGASSFWLVAFAFLIVMGFSTLPSPLYGLYRVRDNLSALTITIVYGIFAAGTVISLSAASVIAARLGRRGLMLASVTMMMVSASLLAGWKALPGLIIGRFLTGVAVGLASGTAITYLIELRLRSDPGGLVRARTIGTAVSVGGIGLGPLVAGFLAQWGKLQLTLPYLVWDGLGLICLAGLSLVPETGTPTVHHTERHAKTHRTTRLPIPAAAGALAAFAANGLFAGLSGLFLSTLLHRPSHALSGATLCLVFTSGVVSQVVTGKLTSSRVLTLGMLSMIAGLALLVVSVRLSIPNLALFLGGGALIGAGSGAVFKGTTGIVIEASAPQDRLALTSELLIALFVGLSVPVVGAGIALNQGVSSPNTVLWFAILVAVGVLASGWWLLGRHQTSESGHP